jgi:hypothetical protein
MTQTTVITDKMREIIGKESDPIINEVDNTGCRQFARSVGYTDAIFFDEEHAKSKGYRGIVAPPGFLGLPVVVPGRPSPASSYSQLDIRYKRVLNGGTDIEYLDDVCAGDRLSVTSKISDLTETEGKLGPMLIVSTETTYKNQDGNVVAIMRGGAIRY